MHRLHGICLAACLALATPLVAAEPSLQPPYSWRGINGSGVFADGDLLTEFWDLAGDIVTNAPKGGH